MARKLLFVCVLSIFFVLSANAQGSSATGTAPAASPAADTAKKPPVFRPNKDQIMKLGAVDIRLNVPPASSERTNRESPLVAVLSSAAPYMSEASERIQGVLNGDAGEAREVVAGA